jgi:uncharacterized protein YjiS (DUF1127 family)
MPNGERVERDYASNKSRLEYSVSFLHRFIVLLKIWRQCLRDRRELAAMDDRSLRDIGLTRYDVELELRKPFWRGLFNCPHQR